MSAYGWKLSMTSMRLFAKPSLISLLTTSSLKRRIFTNLPGWLSTRAIEGPHHPFILVLRAGSWTKDSGSRIEDHGEDKPRHATVRACRTIHRGVQYASRHWSSGTIKSSR
uniref:(northern house mosquito) hypothetical protein n=1 Tax=Culex pipiens TaxID=7175 RepID=A0A8D8B2U2_CULPI